MDNNKQVLRESRTACIDKLLLVLSSDKYYLNLFLRLLMCWLEEMY